jgi:hypothetical protein
MSTATEEKQAPPPQVEAAGDALKALLRRAAEIDDAISLAKLGEPGFVVLPRKVYAALKAAEPTAGDSDPSVTSLDESLAMCDAGMDDIKAGRTRPLDEAFADMERRLKDRCVQQGIPWGDDD